MDALVLNPIGTWQVVFGFYAVASICIFISIMLVRIFRLLQRKLTHSWISQVDPWWIFFFFYLTGEIINRWYDIWISLATSESFAVKGYFAYYLTCGGMKYVPCWTNRLFAQLIKITVKDGVGDVPADNLLHVSADFTECL